MTLGSSLAVMLLAGFPAFGQHQGHELGTVHFPVSCTPEAQQTFERGVALLHSFWYDEAARTFSAAALADPSCAMAYWGIAMSFYHPVWAAPTPDDLQQGLAAVRKATAAAAKTQRERDYIDAIGAFYKDIGTAPHRQRAVAWRNAMERLSARYPADSEAAIFYALALLGTADPRDRTYANQKQAAAILNRLLPLEPDHPGIAHYLIHSYDSPQLAGLALPAARSYARIAPAVPHALHMPSHIFTALGLWQDSIDSNLASAAAARTFAARTTPGATSQDQLHAMDYLEYAYLQTCRDDGAERVMQEAAAVSKVDQEVFQAAYALAAIPARFAIERKQWSEAAALELRPADFPWDRFPFAAAIVYFSRALGAARGGHLAAARTAIEELSAAYRAMAPAAQDYDWRTQIDIQRRLAEAWLAHAEGDDTAALQGMRSTAGLEDQTNKHPVTPGPILPARELLGELLLELNRPAAAAGEFEAVLRTAPRRFNATYGAARAAELSGDSKTATQRYSELLELCGQSESKRADLQRADLQKARAYLAK